MSMLAVTGIIFAAMAGLSAGQAPDLTEPPKLKEVTQSCVCPSRVSADVTFKGFVIDAKVILGSDRRSVEDRMATIFDVNYSDDSKVTGATPVWHHVSESACGVTFDYGKNYTVAARWGENGELETDQCLMGE